MSADISLTDRSTWVMLLSWLAPILTGVFHRDISAYVPAAATILAGLVTGAVLLAKHHYQAAIVTAASTAAAAVAAPATPDAPQLVGPGAPASSQVAAASHTTLLEALQQGAKR